MEWKKCSLCFDEITIMDFINNKYYNVCNDVYCDECFCQWEYNIFWCDRCCKFDHKNDNFVSTKDMNDNIIYYHNSCLFETEKCVMCKDYLKNSECVYIFTDYNCKIEYHKKCVEDCSNMCKYCNVSQYVKCVNCTHRFNDCYNDNCENYVTYEHEEPGRYDEMCRNCN